MFETVAAMNSRANIGAYIQAYFGTPAMKSPAPISPLTRQLASALEAHGEEGAGVAAQVAQHPLEASVGLMGRHQTESPAANLSTERSIIPPPHPPPRRVQRRPSSTVSSRAVARAPSQAGA